MPNIEDYALLGDLHMAALVSTAGFIDWLCLPRTSVSAWQHEHRPSWYRDRMGTASWYKSG